MDNVDAQVLRKAEEWRAAGHHAVLGTVVRTWGSAPRPVGAHVLVRDDGLVVGSVSGGCIEDDLVDKVRGGKVAAERPQRVKYGITADEAFQFGLPCGGTIELILEPVGAGSKVDELLDRVGAGRHTLRRLDLACARFAPAAGDADRTRARRRPTRSTRPALRGRRGCRQP